MLNKSMKLENSVESSKSAQSLGAHRKPLRALIANKVARAFPNVLSTPRAYTSFSHSTRFFRLKNEPNQFESQKKVSWTLSSVLSLFSRENMSL